MNLPVSPPVLPMLAKRIDRLPIGPEWIYEPKWDGFRVLVFRDGKEILLQSRDEKSLNRYFPELIGPLLKGLPNKCVLDGEIVISRSGALDFDVLQLRIHPAASRVKLLSEQTPASIVFFDLIAEGNRDWRKKVFSQRRERLEALLSEAKPPIHITPATGRLPQARDWFSRFEGAGLDGVVAKAKGSMYESDKRTMFKVKHERDCVVAGFRWYRKGDRAAVGSLLLGLYDESRMLQHVGVCGSFPLHKRYELVEYLRPYRKNALTKHPWKTVLDDEGEDGKTTSSRMPGGKSRWSQGKDLSWEPLRLELVAAVAYEHMQGARFRHMAQFRRWRVDKSPQDCTYEQLDVIPPKELKEIFPRDR